MATVRICSRSKWLNNKIEKMDDRCLPTSQTRLANGEDS
jgi:hypothetical protein